jgi:hypothetical protein
MLSQSDCTLFGFALERATRRENGQKAESRFLSLSAFLLRADFRRAPFFASLFEASGLYERFKQIETATQRLFLEQRR